MQNSTQNIVTALTTSGVRGNKLFLGLSSSNTIESLEKRYREKYFAVTSRHSPASEKMSGNLT